MSHAKRRSSKPLYTHCKSGHSVQLATNMSGKTPKGPDRPAESAPDNSTTDAAPLYNSSGLMEGKIAKILMIVLCVFLAIMFVVAFGFCLAGGIEHKQPRYFLLIINMILSTSVTGLLIFWYYRGALSSMMIWYVFIQCLFLLFQFVITDIFAWYETATATPTPTPTPPPHHNGTTAWTPIINCTTHPKQCNGTNNGSSFFGPKYEQNYLTY